MNKPQNYDKISIDWRPLTPGGHLCVIRQVQEGKSSTGLSMLTISFDTAPDDAQPGYYAEQYLSDKQAGRDPLKWRGNQYLVVDAGTDYGTKNLKRFVTAVESSTGQDVVWGEKFSEWFKNKKVGIVFREEEYEKQDGSVGTSVKPLFFCTYDKALEQDVPPKKELANKTVNVQVTPVADPALASEGFMQIADELMDEGLPFA